MSEPDSQCQETARTYARIKRRFYFLGLAVEVAVAVAMWPAGLSVLLARTLDLPYWANTTAYLAVVIAGYILLTLPLRYYEGLRLPRRFGLSSQSLGGWLRDQAKVSVLGLALSLGMLLLAYRLLVSLPGIWWLATAASAITLGVVLTYLTPLVIVPMFFKMKPLADADLSQRLMQLAERARTRITGTYTLDMSRRGATANAAVMGLGKTRRIGLGDTLLHSYTGDEIEVVMAHEMGHHLSHHIVKLSVFQGVILLVGFYLAHLALNAASTSFGFQGMTDVAALPVLATTMGVFLTIVGPFGNAYGRRQETEADDRALALSAKPGAFISLMSKLADQNLTEARPSRWVEILFYSHPPYWKRVERANLYSRSQPGGGE